MKRLASFLFVIGGHQLEGDEASRTDTGKAPCDPFLVLVAFPLGLIRSGHSSAKDKEPHRSVASASGFHQVITGHVKMKIHGGGSSGNRRQLTRCLSAAVERQRNSNGCNNSFHKD